MLAITVLPRIRSNFMSQLKHALAQTPLLQTGLVLGLQLPILNYVARTNTSTRYNPSTGEDFSKFVAIGTKSGRETRS